MAQYGDEHGHVENQGFGTQPASGRNMVRQDAGLNGGSHPQQYGQQQKLARTSSQSSTSSEEDGEGGTRKKKGLTEKIKEKIPGVGHKEHQSGNMNTPTTAVPDGNGEVMHGEDKKGMMDKIKEKLPGVN